MPKNKYVRTNSGDNKTKIQPYICLEINSFFFALNGNTNGKIVQNKKHVEMSATRSLCIKLAISNTRTPKTSNANNTIIVMPT